MFAPHRQPYSILFLIFVGGLAAGCIDADQGAVVVKPRKAKDDEPSTSTRRSSSRDTARTRAKGTRDPKLEHELSKVDELIRQAGGDAADKLALELDDEVPGKSTIRTAFAEEPVVGKKLSTKSETKPAKANRLAKESSPYLLMHAHNPVDWFPWGPEAFEKAKKEGKLIFLSIGYTSCHWCHVMEP